MTRQQRWAEKRKLAGKCQRVASCDEPLVNASYCDKHAREVRDFAREYGRRKHGDRLKALSGEAWLMRIEKATGEKLGTAARALALIEPASALAH